MSIELFKQMLGMLLIFITILIIVVAINESEYSYLIGALITGIMSYLFIFKKI